MTDYSVGVGGGRGAEGTISVSQQREATQKGSIDMRQQKLDHLGLTIDKLKWRPKSDAKSLTQQPPG